MLGPHGTRFKGGTYESCRFPGMVLSWEDIDTPNKGDPMNRPVHFEFVTEDPEALTAFYADVFDWDIAVAPGPQGYWLARTGEGAGIDGGFMGAHFPQPVINTIEIADFEGMKDKILAAGGELVLGPHEIPGVGTHGYFKDPAGIMFGVMQPLASD